NGRGAAERDVKLARKAVEATIVEDVKLPAARVGPRVDQRARTDARRGRAGDVADVVSAGAARAKTEVLDRLNHGDRVLRLDLADLQVGARGDVRVAAAEALGEIGEAGELPMLEDAVGQPQPAHVGPLRRRQVEQAVEPPTEIVRRLGRLVAGRLRLEALVAVERVRLALELLLVGELLALRERAILRLERCRVGAGRLGRD